MGLELVGGAKGEGQGSGAGPRPGEDPRDPERDQARRGPGDGQGAERDRLADVESLREVERMIAAARQRLSGLANRLADLRRAVDPADTTGDFRRPAP